MIASNYRKHPQALALQLPLPWGPALIWHTARPGSRILRKIRAARSHAFKLAGRTKQPAKPTVPAWWKQWKRNARSLAAKVRDACKVLWAEVRVAVTTADTELIGFNYEEAIHQAEEHGNRYRANILKRARAKVHADAIPFEGGCFQCGHQWVRNIPCPVDHRERRLMCLNCHCMWPVQMTRAEFDAEYNEEP